MSEDQQNANQNQEEAKPKKKRKFLMQPIYIVLDDETQVRGDGCVKVIKKSELPTEGSFFAITSDGIKVNKNGILSGLAKIDQISSLADVDARIKLNLPKVPAMIMKRAWHFFNTVFGKMRSESEVCLLYNKDEKKYDLYCPFQKVSFGSVDYEMGDTFTNERPEGYNLVGTIHSHCDFDAYHSGTDEADEKNFDGIHITIGHVNSDTPSLASSAVLGEDRYSYDPVNMCVGWQELENVDPPKWAYNKDKGKRFELLLSDEEEKEFEQYVEQIDKWVEERVSKIVYNNKYKGGNYTNWDYGDDDADYMMGGAGGAFGGVYYGGGTNASNPGSYVNKSDEYNLWDDAKIPEDCNDLEEDGQYRFYEGAWLFFSTEQCMLLDSGELTMDEIFEKESN